MLFNFPPKLELELPGEKIDSFSILARFSSGFEVGTRRRREAMRASSSLSGKSFRSAKKEIDCFIIV
jgi:hypothetical protein